MSIATAPARLDGLPAYLKVREVAELTSLSKSTIWRAVWSGELPSVRLAARARRISRAQLLEWLRKKEASAS
jgi:excisionase family DNA binding protein